MQSAFPNPTMSLNTIGNGTRQHIPTAYSSERLRYIKIDAKDQEMRDFLLRAGNDPNLRHLTYLGPIIPDGPSDIDRIADAYLSSSIIAVAICLAPDDDKPSERDRIIPRGPIIGIIGLMERASLGMVTNRRASLGVWLAAEYQGHDYGEEACNWILDWGFSQVGLHAIDLEVFSNNTHAIEVYKSLGFVQEGRKREAIYFNRKWYDNLIFSILEDEWEALRDKTVYTMDD